MLSISPSLSGDSASFTGSPSDNLYLKAVNGVLEYSGDGTTFSSDLNPSQPGTQQLTLDGSSTITTSVGGTTYLFGTGFQGTLSDSNMTLFDSNRVEISNDLSTSGGSLSITATNSITIDPNVSVSSRLIATGGNPASANSTGPSGNITLTSPSITVDDGASILAQGNDGYTSGNVTLIALQSDDLTWGPTILGFNYTSATTAVNIGDATVKGANVSITTESNTAKTVDLTQNLALDTTAVLLTDVTGDGLPDLIEANYGGATRLYVNNGTPTPFSNVTPEQIGSGYNTTSIAVGDVAGGSRPDLVLGNYDQPSELFVNNNTSTSFSGTPIPIDPSGGTSDPTTSVALADLNDDGRADLVVGNNDAPTRIYLNNGTNNPFNGTPISLGAGTDQTTAVAVATLNGLPDIIVGNNGTSSLLYLNTGTAGSPLLARDSSSTTARMHRPVIPQVRSPSPRLMACKTSSWATMAPPTRVYVNTGDSNPFDGTPISLGTDDPTTSDPTTSLALADVDRSGQLSLIVGNDGAPTPSTPTRATPGPRSARAW